MKRFSIVWVMLLVAAVTFAQKPKYVFYFIGDGMGVNVVNATEYYLGAIEGKIGTTKLLFPSFPYSGVLTSYSANSDVTDSSAAGTALSTGHKTNNGYMGVTPDKKPVQNIAEKAKAKGKKVAVLTTVSVDHATPGAFYAHQPSRGMLYEIACDLPKAGFDFYGGSGFLKPAPEGKTPIWDLFKDAGYTVARGLNDYDQKASSTDKMILLLPENYSNVEFPYSIDQKPGDMNLADLTKKAVDFVTKGKNNKGFFMMVEGGMIDHALHTNDGACAVKEVVDFDNAIKVAYEFYQKYPKETLIVVTADHNTGGICTGTHLERLQYQTCSVDALSNEIAKLRKKDNVTWDDAKALLKEKMGFWTKVPITWDQEYRIFREYGETFVNKQEKIEETLYARTHSFASLAKRIMNEAADLSWTTGGHTADYVPLFAVGAGAENFTGRLDNTEVPKRLEKVAGY